MGMKRECALALFVLAASLVLDAQIHGVPPSVTSLGAGRTSTPGVAASITSLGPGGYGWGDGRHDGTFTFGHHPGFVSSSRHRNFHRHYFPVAAGPYYWPYYGWDYSLEPNDNEASRQMPQQVVIVDPRSDDYPRDTRSVAAPPADPTIPAQEQEPTILVFRDGHKHELRNYVIVGQMLWDFSAKPTRKIPLADLDLDTTRKLNEDRGVEFVLPKS